METSPADAGVTTDADSGVHDAGEATDAGVSDAGLVGSDAGLLPDADAGAGPDAGPGGSPDAGAIPDAGAVDAGLSSSGCAGSLSACTGTCRDLAADAESCGACGRICGSGQVCNQGTCAPLPVDCTVAPCGPGYGCDPLTRRCVAGCRLSTECPAGATCQQGQCRCAPGQHACGQACVSDTAVTSCGQRCVSCPAPATNGSAACTNGVCGIACTPGYAVSGASCVDIDECASGNGGCGPFDSSSCTNTPGSRTCGCRTGYAAADGGVCTDIDECQNNNGGCANIAVCTNSVGGRACTCPAGWTGDGLSCTRVTCALNNGGCDPNADCLDTPGWPACTCRMGFEGSGQSCLPVTTPKVWRQVMTPAAPPGRSGAAMAYDPVRRRTVLFGGQAASTSLLDDVWEFDGTTWVERVFPAPAKPSPRRGAAMTWDPSRSVIVLVGGASPVPEWAASPSNLGVFRDVWEYDGTTWTLVGSAPVPVSGAVLVPDSARNRLWLVGGRWAQWDATFLRVREYENASVFERAGTSWSVNPRALPSLGGSSRGGPGFGWDGVRSVLVMTGGASNETWTFDGTTWTDVVGARQPVARTTPALVWDAARQRVVMSGGTVGSSQSTETWEYDGTSWAPLVSAGPALQGVPAMAFDSHRNRVVLFGGSSSAQTWELRVPARGTSGTWVTSSIAASCDALTGSTTLLGSATTPALGDEAASATVALPFAFAHFGVPVTHYSVQTNGLVQFHTSATGRGTQSTFLARTVALPSTNDPSGFFAALWGDLDARGPQSRVHAQTLGSVGRRVHVVEWSDVAPFSDPTRSLRFQVKLLEDTGELEAHWCTLPSVPAQTVVAAENLAGTSAVSFTGTPVQGGGVRFTP